MNVEFFLVDAFTPSPFSGNSAGVCILSSEADPGWMQSVAAEMKHPETAFVRPLEGGWELRWFTPTVEAELCGHATLAAAHALWESGHLSADQTARFHTRSGLLEATKAGKIRLDFPTEAPTPCAPTVPVAGLSPIWTGHNRMDWMFELSSEAEVREFEPDMSSIAALGNRGLIITARSSGEFDFASRMFAPQAGIPEDPVTGSAHCCLAPYWASKLGKNRMTGYQASARGGIVGVELAGDRTYLFGDAVTVLAGTLRC